MQHGIKFIESLIWFSLVLWFDIEHTDKHKQGPIDWQTDNSHIYKYISTPPVHTTGATYPLLHRKNNLLQQGFTLQRSGISFSKIENFYSLVEVIDLLITFNMTKSFLWNTKNTNKNDINEQNTHTPHREKDNFRNS